ncbi:60S ribosomal protein L16, mitochondrial [Artemisia annua]|uniref:60S ribosomal protein L16, mitochondrial n=1 Tax=Artemisia annua TaxID=35608 RepID=A0A2U1QAN8_ARTAN|nr:60S ribosomal protein L16, mitochondrial [Artemisia annua]
MDEFEGSSHHDSNGRRLMATEEEEIVNWNEYRGDRPVKGFLNGKIDSISAPQHGNPQLTRIKSVFGSLGVYYFSTFKVPKKIIRKLEAIRRNFFREENALWNKIIHFIHVTYAELNNTTSVSSRWVHVASKKCWNLMAKDKPVNSASSYNWAIPSYYKRTIPKKWVRVLADLPIIGKHIELRMRRGKGNPGGWIARASIGQFPFKMDGVVLHYKYHISTTLLIRIQHQLHVTSAPQPKILPLEVYISSWRITKERLPTRVNLDRRGIDMDAVHCLICDEDLETDLHLFVTCNVPLKLRGKVLNWWNIRNITFLSLHDMINLADTAPIPAATFNLVTSLDDMYFTFGRLAKLERVKWTLVISSFDPVIV